jgi:superoxide dismutase, Cu-Zn family
MKRRRRVYISLIVVVLAALAAAPWGVGLARDGWRGERKGKVTLLDAGGGHVGNAVLTTTNGGVQVDITVHGLTPGFHGFHVHSIGVCDGTTGFTSAGGHFNPGGDQHPHHAADFPVLLVQEDGIGEAHFYTDRFAVGDLFDADGSALIIHAGPDNYANVPTRYAAGGPDATTLGTGDAGGRAACGLITH